MPCSKILPLSQLAREVASCRDWDDTFALCHGCFDLVHLGHIRHLQDAAALGSHLVVTLTSDRFINKGPGRPFFTQDQRAEALAALGCVDYVAINDAPDASAAIRLLRPDYFVKGPECRTRETPGLLAERAAIAEVGGKLVFTEGEIFSSTEIGRKVLAWT